MEEQTRNIVDSALAAAAQVRTFDVCGVPHVAVPSGYALQECQQLLPRPPRARGVVQLHDTASFTAYVASFKTASTRIYCNADYKRGSATLTAIFNEHASVGNADWRDFRAVYSLRHSEEWQRWIGMDCKPQTQAAFATFLEENLRDIADDSNFPTGAEMLRMALDLEANQDSRFKSSVRLQSGGVDLTFVEKEDAETLNRMSLFERFAIGIPPFFNGPAYRVEARLRYRVRDMQLAFWYDLIRPDLTVADAVKNELASIAASTGIGPLYGEP